MMFLFLILVFLSLKHIEVKAQDGCHNEVKYDVEAREGNSNPLQGSCLENSVDREAWALAGLGCTCIIYKYDDSSWQKKKKKQPFSKNLHRVMHDMEFFCDDISRIITVLYTQVCSA